MGRARLDSTELAEVRPSRAPGEGEPPCEPRVTQ
jgi:hypothetical protein